MFLAKKDKGKEKKHKSKTGKKVKEKKEEKEEKDEKPEHVQFEETPQILTPETNIQVSSTLVFHLFNLFSDLFFNALKNIIKC